MSSVLERDSWTTKVDFMSADIFEYDMRRGGLSIIKEKQLLPQSEIQRLENMEKHAADVEVGKLERKNKVLRDGKKDGFKEYRLLFAQQNDLVDDDIVSVKKDAIFCKKYCPNNKIGNFIEFREKHQYHAFMRLPKMELYWNSDTGDIDVKGIDDTRVMYHKEYLLKDISQIIQRLSYYDIQGAKKKVVQLMNDYKQRRLAAGYYREFNPGSCFCQYMNESFVLIDVEDMADEFISELNIEYNYLNVLVPLLDLIAT